MASTPSSPPRPPPPTLRVNAISMADLNGDAHPDLVVVNMGQPAVSSSAGGTVDVLLNRGDGTFAPEVSYASLGATALAIGDLNDDGKLDVAVANDASTYLSVFFGRGDGTLQPAVSVGPSGSMVAVGLAMGDLNGDGHPDLALADENRSVEVLINNGDGSFQPPVAYPTLQDSCCLAEPNSVAIADFDGDGRLDLAVANSYEDISVLRGNGDGTFQPQVAYTTNREPESIHTADVDGDGRADILVATTNSPDVAVLLGKGDGTFLPQQFFAVSNNTSAIAVGDVNGDGRPDVVATDGNTQVGVLLNGCKR
jgi:hypothetical protein